MRARKKRQRGRVPVASHEGFQILTVPCRLLILNHLPNRDTSGIARILPNTRNGQHSNHTNQQNQITHEASPIRLSHHTVCLGFLKRREKQNRFATGAESRELKTKSRLLKSCEPRATPLRPALLRRRSRLHLHRFPWPLRTIYFRLVA